MRYDHEIIEIDTFRYAVFKIDYFYNEETGFLYLGKTENSKVLKIFVLIPSWVEIQDMYCLASKKNIANGKYEIVPDKMDDAKIFLFCNKMIDEDGTVYQMDTELLKNLHLNFAFNLLNLIDFTINEYNVGSGLGEDQRKSLAEKSFAYYSAVNKRKNGERVEVPPKPGIIMLLDICEDFNCTPDVARKISYTDIEGMCVVRKQEYMAVLMK